METRIFVSDSIKVKMDYLEMAWSNEKSREFAPKKILVEGSSGAGKQCFSRYLSELTGHNHRVDVDDNSLEELYASSDKVEALVDRIKNEPKTLLVFSSYTTNPAVLIRHREVIRSFLLNRELKNCLILVLVNDRIKNACSTDIHYYDLRISLAALNQDEIVQCIRKLVREEDLDWTEEQIADLANSDMGDKSMMVGEIFKIYKSAKAYSLAKENKMPTPQDFKFAFQELVKDLL